MNYHKLLRTILFIIGVMIIFLLLVLGNIDTDRIIVSSESLIDFEELNGGLYLLEPKWEVTNSADQEIFKAEIRVLASNAYSGIYMPLAKNVEFYVNGSMKNLIYENEHYIYLFEPSNVPQEISLEMRIPHPIHELYYSTSEIYVGDYNHIIFASNRESNLRLFIVGLSFTIILFSISLFVQKPSEKYLLVLAFLAYSTFGYVLLKAYPSLEENPLIGLLLMGAVKIPFLSIETSYSLYRIGFPLIVAFLNYLLLKNFVSIKILQIGYFRIVLLSAFLVTFFIGNQYFSFIVLGYRFFINFLEIIVIIKGDYEYKTDSAILLLGAIGTLSLKLFISACSFDLVPSGDVDLLYRLGGVHASAYAIAFTVAINGIFARKYAESEILSSQLNDLNKNLKQIVSERTSELKTAYKSLEKEQQQKDIFTTNMVHSLKTPLFSIAGFADMAHEALKTSPEKVKSFIDVINANADFVVNLVNNLFLALRLENNQVNYMIEKVNLCTMMQQIYNTTLPQSQLKEITVKMELFECPIMIECDLYYLTLAVQNIVDNAVRHTPQSGEIVLSLSDWGEKVKIVIADNGEGMSEEVIKQIFERYYSYTNNGHESSGLGLTISKDVINALGGDIIATSSLEGGAKFTIVLPKSRQQIENNKISK